MRLKTARPGLGWLLLVVGICLLAWLLFITHLGRESMGYDEWFSWDHSRLGPLGLVTNSAEGVHPPAYYLWVWAWITWTQSDDVFVMRLSSVIPALLAVAMCYRVGSDWFRSRWVGLASALFLATSGVFVYYSRELGMVTLLAFLALVSWWRLWRALRKDQTLKSYAVLVALMLYTNYFTVIMIVVQAVAAVVFYRKRLVNLGLAYGVALVVFLLWLPNQLAQVSLNAATTPELTAESVSKFAAIQPTSLETVSDWLVEFTAHQPAFVLLLVGLAVLLVYNAPRIHRQNFIFVVAWLAGTILLFWGINLVIPVYSLRDTLLVLPALALLVGVAVDRAPSSTRFALVGLIGVLGIASHVSAFLEPKLPHRELMQMVADHYLPGDRIWYNFSNGALGSSVEFESLYYLQRIAPNISTDEFVWDAPHDFEDVETVPRVWDVRPYWITIPDNVASVLDAGRAVTEEYHIQGYWVRLYEAPPDAQTPIVFDDLLALELGPMEQTAYQPGDTVKVKAWWRALETPTLDYSYSLFLRRGDTVIGQVDEALQIQERPTTQWAVSSSFDFSQPAFTLPDDLAPGDYSLWLSVHDVDDPHPVPVSAPQGQSVEDGLVQVAQISIH